MSKATETGVAVLDLTSPPLNAGEYTANMMALAAMYRTDYLDEKWDEFQSGLFHLVLQDGWSVERFKQTCSWIAKNTPFANLTVADFFKAPVAMLHPYPRYEMEMKAKNPKWQVEVYKLSDGLFVCKERDGNIVPGIQKVFPRDEYKIHANSDSLPVAALEPHNAAPCPPPPDVKAAMEKLAESLGDRNKGMARVGDMLPNVAPVELSPLDPETESMLKKAEQEAKERMSK